MITLLNIIILASFQCKGVGPLAPLGCESMCICNSSGECSWQFDCTDEVDNDD